jgi:hypothetical protein
VSRPRKVITDAQKRKQHEASLERRRNRHALAKSLEALQEEADGDADFERLVEAEKAKIAKMEIRHGVAGGKAPPKTITAARENLTRAFDLMGGVPALVVWGRKNPTEFYRLWARLIPKESVEVSATLPLEALLSRLASHEQMSVGEAAYQIGSDILAEARDQVIEHDANVELRLASPEDDED